MKLNDILAISGKPGLFKYVAQGTNGIIVESLAEGRRTNVPAIAQVSSMAEIAIYTETEDMSISEVFTRLYDQTEGKKTISHKSSADELKGLFEEIVPDYDRYMVHVSDMKKIVQWYNILVEAGMSDFSLEGGEGAEEGGENEPETESESKE